MPVSLRDIPHLAKLLSLDSIVPCLYHTPGYELSHLSLSCNDLSCRVSWSKGTLNELYQLVGLSLDSGRCCLIAA